MMAAAEAVEASCAVPMLQLVQLDVRLGRTRVARTVCRLVAVVVMAAVMVAVAVEEDEQFLEAHARERCGWVEIKTAYSDAMQYM